MELPGVSVTEASEPKDAGTLLPAALVATRLNVLVVPLVRPFGPAFKLSRCAQRSTGFCLCCENKYPNTSPSRAMSAKGMTIMRRRPVLPGRQC